MSKQPPRFRVKTPEVRSWAPLGVSEVLPQPAREALVRAAQSGNSTLLDQTLTQLRRKYPHHFKQEF